MKIVLGIVLILATFGSYLYGQHESTAKSKWDHFGAVLTVGLSTQVHSDPSADPDLGKEGEGLLPMWGLGINYTIGEDSWFSLRPQLSYLRKGSSYRGQVNGGQFEFNNVFHYLGTDVLLLFKINKWKTKPYWQSGLRGELLLRQDVGYNVGGFPFRRGPFSIDSFSSNTNYSGFERFNYSLVNGVGVAFSKGWYVEFNTNFDLGYVVKKASLEVRHYVANLSFGIGL